MLEVDDVLAIPQTGHVQNEHHAPVAENRRARESLDFRELRAERLDHDFARAAQTVDLNGDFARAGARDQHGHLLAVARHRGNAQPLTQMHVGEHLLVMGEQRILAHREAGNLLDRKFYDIDDRPERERKKLVADVHHEGLRDGKRQRQAHDERGPHALLGVDRHAAAQLLHFAVHHVHAHAAPGDMGDFIRGGKAGHENELDQLFLRQVGVGGHQPAFDRLGADRLDVEPRAVVGKADDDLAAFL